MRDDEREEGQEPVEGTPENEQPVEETPEAASEQAPEAAAEEAPAEEAPAEPVAEEAPAEEPVADEAPADPAAEAPAEEPVAEEAPAEPVAEAPAEEPAAEEAPAEPVAETPADEEAPAADAAPAADEAPAERARRREQPKQPEEEVIPGAHLEPDIVFEEQQKRSGEDEFGDYSKYAEPEPEGEAAASDAPDAATADSEPVALTPRELAADARYIATGKRKRAVARVILKPGEGTYQVNGRHLDEYFPRVRLQRTARQPLEAAGYQSRMDVIARIHGGGVSAQATALRHGIARALVEADPNLRGELKKRGYLTRDPRVKERKKAGLKKARKRPQFSKR
jgi:small subunit ribosomal protein S9